MREQIPHISPDSTVLIADPASGNAQAIRSTLFELGFANVHHAYSGLEAVKALKLKPYGLVLCSEDISDVRATDVLQVTRASKLLRHLPFMIISRAGDRERFLIAVESGVTDYLIMPVTSDLLRDAIARSGKPRPATLIEWESLPHTGIAAIDEQHHKLVSLTNELHSAMSRGQGGPLVSWIIEQLLEYTTFHFSFEEDVFRDKGYPEREAHCKAHGELREQVLMLRRRIARGEQGVSVDMLALMKRWLGHHILKVDMGYVPWVACARCGKCGKDGEPAADEP